MAFEGRMALTASVLTQVNSQLVNKAALARPVPGNQHISSMNCISVKRIDRVDN